MYFKVLHFFQSMSGDSSTHQHNNKKVEEDSSLALEHTKGPIATAASGVALIAVEGAQEKDAEIANPEEKQEKSEFVKRNKEENNVKLFIFVIGKVVLNICISLCDAYFFLQDGAGDYKEVKDDKTSLENENVRSKSSNIKYDKEKGDLVDSVYLRPPPSHKGRSNTQTNDDEDCGIKCLYYTLQCCDCVLM